MVSLSTRFRYFVHKMDYSMAIALKELKDCSRGQISKEEVRNRLWRNLCYGKLTYLHRHKGGEMAPTVGNGGGTLLVRRIPIPEPFHVSIGHSVITRDSLNDSEGHRMMYLGDEMVSVGDIVLMKDPDNSKSHLVRRLAAVGGYEMVSTDEREDPFVLQQDECWVLSDNDTLTPKEAKDSRTFGPVRRSNIMGRVIYCMRNTEDHGPVQNSDLSMEEDAPVLEVELDVKEMAKNLKKSP